MGPTTAGAQPQPSAPVRRRTTREEYHRAAALGLYGQDEKLELIRGEVVRKVSPQGAVHYAALDAAGDHLTGAFGAGFWVRRQGPLTLPDDSEPEPDVSVVVGSAQEYPDRHPASPDVVLVVEVADTSLAYDRGEKAALYAEAGIADYWIVNLRDRQVEVLREPGPTAGMPHGYGYRSTMIRSAAETVTPLAAPGVVIAVDSLLPAPSA